MAKEREVTVILNPAPAVPLDPGTIAMADYFIPNDTEFTFYQNAGYERAPGQTLIVTRGDKGVRVVTEDGERDFAPFVQNNVIDTTGAGDTFVGTFAAAIEEGIGRSESVERAIVSSSISVTRHEVVPSIPHREAVNGAYSVYRKGINK